MAKTTDKKRTKARAAKEKRNGGGERSSIQTGTDKDQIAPKTEMAEGADKDRCAKQEISEVLNTVNDDFDAKAAKHARVRKILQGRSPESGLITYEQFKQLDDLGTKLEESMRVRREAIISAETPNQGVDKDDSENFEVLDSDYDLAMQFVEGTERMLQRMKDELIKQEARNARLEADLEEAKRKANERQMVRIETSSPPKEKVRSNLTDISELRDSLNASAMLLEKQMRDARTQLESLRVEHDRFELQHQLRIQSLNITQ